MARQLMAGLVERVVCHKSITPKGPIPKLAQGEACGSGPSHLNVKDYGAVA